MQELRYFTVIRIALHKGIKLAEAVRQRNGLKCFKKGMNGRILWKQWWALGFHRCSKFSDQLDNYHVFETAEIL